MTETAPYVLTLTLNRHAQEHFDSLRRRYFPADRLVVGAHVTLFHALPNDLSPTGAVACEAAAQVAFPLHVTGLRQLGRGVAFALESTPLRQLRNRLREPWLPRLTPQDRQPWQPHVTIQNKVDAAVARQLFVRLQAEFTPHEVTATGLALWLYRGGPWEAAGSFAFKA